MLENSSYASQWQKNNKYRDLQEGDIVFIDGMLCIYLYMEGGKCLDQKNYCVVSSSGSDNRGTLLNASLGSFQVAFRYTGAKK